ncbi:glutamyl-tRNA reductase [Cenarchaeum symbiosum A]|uniref:Glutamyl-tRNA reductase n=1 Tax=Cenarchaeum symbiosum (strain A) TaxID=414004 RepID=HEM1_CENSY|nr:RecName: Full=Glutamyl-tRNA reductase; Short=GluTR [Cenarchaeum symbiosum A]ABK78025.1 glutamyl-tRNA reductase [Cenarchaeum symbiosum A]
MIPGLINARVTFHNSPVHALERFTFRDVGAALEGFRAGSGLDECVIVQTCNRVELFGASASPDMGSIRRTWASLAGIDESLFGGHLESSGGGEVLEHLLRLTSGLDSMVVGEEQILGQVKNAITSARTSGASGRRLNTLFDRAIRSGTRIRNSTGIGSGGVSVGSMAVRLVEENMDDLHSRSILLIGTGEVSTLVAKSLGKRGYDFSVASRTLQRSQAFCSAMGGSPVLFEDVLDGFGGYDVLFVATGAPYFLVTYDKISEVLESRGGMMILDLSNPRTVDEKVATLGGIKLMNLDQIAEMVSKNMRNRMSSVGKVEQMISGEVPVMEAAMNRLDAEPIAEAAFKEADALRRRELAKALQMLGNIGGNDAKVIDDLTRALVESIMSAPMNNLRRASEEGDADVVDAAARLFDYRRPG